MLPCSLSLLSVPLSTSLSTSLQARYLKGKELGLHVDMSQGPIPNANSLPPSSDFLGPTLYKTLITI